MPYSPALVLSDYHLSQSLQDSLCNGKMQKSFVAIFSPEATEVIGSLERWPKIIPKLGHILFKSIVSCNIRNNCFNLELRTVDTFQQPCISITSLDSYLHICYKKRFYQRS